MGFEKKNRPLLASRGVKINSSGRGLEVSLETLTASDVTQTMKVNGVSRLVYNTSGVKAEFRLPAPGRTGVLKKILVVKGTSSEELRIHTATTAAVFDGTTFNTVALGASTVNPSGSYALDLVSVSSAAWAVTAIGSTGHWDFSASTGSTDL
jgi:hypothetical protein